MGIDQIGLESPIQQAPQPPAHGAIEGVWGEIHADLGNNQVTRMLERQPAALFVILDLPQYSETGEERGRPGHGCKDAGMHIAAGRQVPQPGFDEDPVRRLLGIGKEGGGGQD